MTSELSLVFGATGLVGTELVKLLLEKGNKVRTIGRRKIGFNHQNLEEVILDSLDQMDASHFMSVTTVYCCLGTTIKAAKTQEAFRKVDYDYPLRAAQLTKEIGIRKFVCISAKGSSVDSSFFYSRVKGELERDLFLLSIDELFIVKPSLLLGERAEFRLVEAIGQIFSKSILPVLKFTLGTYCPIEAKQVALTMWEVVNDGLHSSKNIQVDTKRQSGLK